MELNEYFEYRDGSLVWKARSSEFFNNKRIATITTFGMQNTLGKLLVF